MNKEGIYYYRVWDNNEHKFVGSYKDNIWKVRDRAVRRRDSSLRWFKDSLRRHSENSSDYSKKWLEEHTITTDDAFVIKKFIMTEVEDFEANVK